MIEKRDVQLTPVGGYKPDVMLPSGAIHHLPSVQALPQPLSLREILSVFRRQWLPMAIIALLALAYGIYSSMAATRVYRSETSMLVEGAKGEPGGDPVNEASMPMRLHDMQTQVQILQSAKIREDAYRLAGIDWQVLPLQAEPEIMPVVMVEPVGESSVLRIIVDSSRPEFAEKVAFHIPAVYRGYLRTTRQGEVVNAEKNLNDRLKSEKAALAKAEIALVDFQKKRSLTPIEGESSTRSGQAMNAQETVKRAEADVLAAKTTLNSLRVKRAALQPKLRRSAKSANAGAIEEQKGRIAQLKSERAVMLRQYHEDHQFVLAKDVEIQNAEARLRAIPLEIDAGGIEDHPEIREYDRQIAQAEADLDGANARLNRYRTYESQAETELSEYQNLAPDQRRLEQDIVDRKETINWIRRQLDDLRVRNESARDPVVVLYPPSPAGIIRPRPVQYTALALLFGIFLAVAFALVKDSLDDRIANPDEVFRLTGLPLLGEVLPLPARSRHVGSPGLNSRFVERYRVLRFNLGLLLAKNPARSIVVTSSGRLEGKTEVACNLAYAAAEGESRRVILIDADFRRPAAHKRFGIAEKPGLADIVLGQATLEEALQPGPVPGLQIIASGGTMSNPVDLLAMPQIIDLLARLEGLADLVIFDSPASTGLADAHVLSRIADSVVYVAKTGRTKRTALRKGVEAFRQAGVRVLGVVEVAERARR